MWRLSELPRKRPAAFLLLLLPLTLLALWRTLAIEVDNSLEVWRIAGTEPTRTYERFLETFGSEEFILIAVERTPGNELSAALERTAIALEALPGITRVDTLPRLAHELGLPPRLLELPGSQARGFLISRDGLTSALVASVDPNATSRPVLVENVRAIVHAEGAFRGRGRPGWTARPQRRTRPALPARSTRARPHRPRALRGRARADVALAEAGPDRTRNVPPPSPASHPRFHRPSQHSPSSPPELILIHGTVPTRSHRSTQGIPRQHGGLPPRRLRHALPPCHSQPAPIPCPGRENAACTSSPHPLTSRGRALELLSIEVEGLDLAILKTWDFERVRPKVICTETKQLTANGQIEDLIEFVLSKGYELRGATFVNSIFVDRERLRAKE